MLVKKGQKKNTNIKTKVNYKEKEICNDVTDNEINRRGKNGTNAGNNSKDKISVLSKGCPKFY